jgi:hypothetical protein
MSNAEKGRTFPLVETAIESDADRLLMQLKLADVADPATLDMA